MFVALIGGCTGTSPNSDALATACASELFAELVVLAGVACSGSALSMIESSTSPSSSEESASQQDGVGAQLVWADVSSVAVPSIAAAECQGTLSHSCLRAFSFGPKKPNAPRRHHLGIFRCRAYYCRLFLPRSCTGMLCHIRRAQPPTNPQNGGLFHATTATKPGCVGAGSGERHDETEQTHF